MVVGAVAWLGSVISYIFLSLAIPVKFENTPEIVEFMLWLFFSVEWTTVVQLVVDYSISISYKLFTSGCVLEATRIRQQIKAFYVYD